MNLLLSSPTTPCIVRAQDAECHELPGEARRVLLDGHATGGALSLSHTQLPFGSGPPLHVHTHEDELFWVERGEFALRTGAQTVKLQAGDFAFGPRGVPHAYTCCSAHGGALWVAVVGAGFENFFRQMARAFESGVPLGPLETRELAATFGVRFDGFEPSPAAPQVVRAGEGECLAAFGDSVRVLVASQTVRHRFCAVEFETPPLGGSPSHVHEGDDETFLVMEGCYEFCVDDARILAHPGDVVWAPRQVAHSFRVVSPQPGRLLAIATPGGFDDFFREANRAWSSGEATPQAMSALGARHGIRFLPAGSVCGEV